MLSTLRPALVLFGLLSLLTGLAYPALVTGVAQVLLPWQANGSLVVGGDGQVLGSRVVGQAFDDPRYFWSRPSATGAHPYDGASSSGSNAGPTNPALAEAIAARVEALRAADPESTAPIPVELVTASASGLDPDLSPAGALYQVARVARVRHLPEADVRALVERHVEGRTLGLLGEPRVDVLALNLALDALARPSS
ncbi:MAG: potassium-transporting ATPase subunit KdpC [Sandaracinus sp.]